MQSPQHSPALIWLAQTHCHGTRALSLPPCSVWVCHAEADLARFHGLHGTPLSHIKEPMMMMADQQMNLLP